MSQLPQAESPADFALNFPNAPVASTFGAAMPAAPSLLDDALRLKNSCAAPRPPYRGVADCQQEPWLTFYFDGTGNNEEVDTPTLEHSNVSRLYRARVRGQEEVGKHNLYIPGIGTPFKEIGDRGSSNLKLATAGGGQARLDWAWTQFEDRVARAVAKAMNPVNKIRMIHVAVFGFSRGAASARAFAVKLQTACERSGAGWVLKNGKYPVRLYFMGLFDTVASVGVPTAARKYSDVALAAAPFVGTLPVLLTAQADGHASWAKDLRIPAMAEKCIHYVAAHEIRNSFPVDTVIDNGQYPANCTECVYPGVHSNVGGGYRPGEGGRLAEPAAMLSLVPLQAMYNEAYRAGVPLRSMSELRSKDADVYRDFAPATPEQQQARTRLNDLFNHYMTQVGWGGQPVGKLVCAHMRLYYRWRIIDVGRKVLAQRQGALDASAQRLAAYEVALRTERGAKQVELQKLNDVKAAAQTRAAQAAVTESSGRASAEMRAQAKQRRLQAEADAARAEDQIILLEATIATMPDDDGSLNRNIAHYDRQFLDDSERVLKESVSKLRGIEVILREAWDAAALNDPKIIAFFDDYVIDSLAGFAKDRTRAVEARILYQGGDGQVKYVAGPQGGDDELRAA